MRKECVHLSSQSKGKHWTGAVFGFIFLLAGMTVAYGSDGKMIIDYVMSANWVETPATIQQLKLDTLQGEESATYSVKGSDSYLFDGVSYKSNRISVSLGNDNFGNYWQNLYTSLQASQGKNEAIAFVNANSPSNSVLDRTFRWTWVLFASVFLFFLGGMGALIMWLSLRDSKNNEKTREKIREHENKNGIKCNEQASYLLLAILGTMFFVAGTIISLIAIPDAIRKGEYVTLLTVLFAFAGVAIMNHAHKIYRGFHKFGATLLSLDPPSPDVGGQLGGIFLVDNTQVSQSLRADTSLRARLTCKKKTGSGKSRMTTIIWREESPVYLTQSSQGAKGQFVFDIPGDCHPSKDWEHNSSFHWDSDSSITWDVSIEGEFKHADLGKIGRSWNVHMADAPAPSNNVLSIPAPFLKKAKERTRAHAKLSARDQIPITEDAHYIEVLSNAGRHIKTNVSLFLLGLIFGAGGVFTLLDGWWPGLVFLAVGAIVCVCSVFILGKSVQVKIDKQLNILYSRQSWFGIAYTNQQGKLNDASQFDVKKTASQTIGKKYTEFYTLNFHSDDKDIPVAEQITGKYAAEALKELILARCFFDTEKQKAA